MIVNPPQINIGGHLAIRQRLVEVFRPRFADAEVANAIEVFVLDGDLPAPPRFILLFGDNVFHDLLPGARGEFGIGGVEIHPRQPEADGRHPFRLIHGVDPLFRFRLHASLEAYRVARHVVECIPHAPRAFEFPIPLCHILCFHFVRICRRIFSRIRAMGVPVTGARRIVSGS